MQRGVAAIVALFIVTGLGGTGGQEPGLSLAEAESLAVEQARAMRETVFYPEYWETRKRVLIGTFPSRNSRGEDAWLSIFRLTGVENDPDQACVWVWRATKPPDEFGFEEAVSVGYGSTADPVHERCAEEVFSRGIADPEQTGGVEMAPPVFSRPDPVTPFGTSLAVLYPRDFAGPDSGVTVAGIGIELPVGSSPGTCGFAGFVLDEDTEQPVPGATITVKPSRAWSGVSEGDKAAAATARADRLGGFVMLDFPDEALGYDVTIDAPGYARARIVHQGATPQPVRR
jgi:hypothetical protein